jgi:hypothetical protein
LEENEEKNEIARLNAIPTVFDRVYIITLGPEMGIMMLNDMVKVSRRFGRMKTEMLD